jgi:hypothetical protein
MHIEWGLGQGKTMSLLDALLIAGGTWLLVLIVTGIVNSARHGREERRSGIEY